MRPIQMTLENFGPFEKAEVDFERFESQENSSLFLITGQTGSGKTTLFDALCFALYGATSGGKRDPKEMRSQFATTEETVVTLLFEAKGKTYLLTRKPEQYLPKKKGEGYTKRNPLARLVELRDGKKVASEEGIQTVNRKVQDLVALTLDEFSQIVLLPQGEFRRFLTSDSNQKEEVLRSLFQTTLYQEVTKEIYQRYKNKEKEYQDLKKQQDYLLQDISLEEVPTEEELQQLVNRQEKKEQQAKITWETAKEDFKNVETQLREEQEQEKKRENLKVEKQDFEKLLESKSDIEKLKNENQRLEKVSHLLPYEKEILQLTEEEKELLEKKMTTELKLAELQVKKQENIHQQKMHLEKQAEMLLLEQEAQHLKENLDLYENYHRFKNEEKDLQKELQIILPEETKLQEKTIHLKEEIKEVEARLLPSETLMLKQQVLYEEKEKLVKQSENVAKLANTKEKIDHLQQELTQHTQKLKEITEKVSLTQQELEEIQNQSRLLEIARLALQLKPGTPCPICGNTEHPHPFQLPKGNLEEVEAKEKALQKILKKETTVQIQLKEQIQHVKDSLETFILEQEAQIVAFPYLKEAKQYRENLKIAEEKHQKEQERLQKEQEEQKSLQQQQNLLKKQVLDFDEKLQKIKEKAQEKSLKQEILKGQLALLKEKIQEKYLQQPLKPYVNQLEEKLEKYKDFGIKLNQEKEDIQQIEIKEKTLLTEIKRQVTATKNELQVKKSAFQEKLIELELTEDLFRKYKEKQENLFSNKKQIQDFEEACLKKESLIQQLQKEVTKKVLDIPTLFLKIEEKKKQAHQLEEAFYQEKSATQKIQEVFLQYQKLSFTIRAKIEELKELKELSDVTKGEKPYPISLERFVLQQRFKEVLLKANEKLHDLSKGRYELVLNEEEGSAKKYTGLELDIYDEYTGGKRRVQTLSGGESFMTALSLALGLGEVIQMRAGGIRIQLLLIDEGFGTLDEEALEMAIDALESLETNGRTIGIISHVKALRQRIPLKLQVVSLENGRSKIKNLPLAGETE